MTDRAAPRQREDGQERPLVPPEVDVPETLVRSSLMSDFPPAIFEGIVTETEALLDRRLRKVNQVVEASRSDVNLNAFLMLALAPTYNLYSPFEIAEFIQMSKFHHGDATAYGRYVEDKILGPIGAVRPPEKPADPSLFSSIDKEITVEDTRYLMTIKSGPWTMNQSHANEMIANFPAIHEQTGCDLLIGVTYGTKARLNNKPKLVVDNTGPYVHVLVGRAFWEFVTGVENAHLHIFQAIREAQRRFAEKHAGRTVYEQMIEARLALSQSVRDVFGLTGQDVEMWETIFNASF